jgi:hypothetical protein
VVQGRHYLKRQVCLIFSSALAQRVRLHTTDAIPTDTLLSHTVQAWHRHKGVQKTKLLSAKMITLEVPDQKAHVQPAHLTALPEHTETLFASCRCLSTCWYEAPRCLADALARCYAANVYNAVLLIIALPTLATTVIQLVPKPIILVYTGATAVP